MQEFVKKILLKLHKSAHLYIDVHTYTCAFEIFVVLLWCKVNTNF